MDQYLSTVIIAIITGVFSTITLIIQKKQDKVINKIDEQTSFIEKEKDLKQRLSQKQKERDSIIHDMMILILDTNLDILKNSQLCEEVLTDDDVFAKSEILKKRFIDLTESIEDLNKEYDMVLDMTSQFQREIEKMNIKK